MIKKILTGKTVSKLFGTSTVIVSFTSLSYRANIVRVDNFEIL